MKLVNLLIGSLALASIGLVLLSQKQDNTTSDYEKYMEFRRMYRKGVSSPEELDYRFQIFQSNLRKHEEHNKSGSSYTQGINQFTDLTWEEFKEGYLQEPIQNTDEKFSGIVDDQFRKVDWTKQMNPVKNQGQCGSCWAFSTVGALEGLYRISKKQKVSLSEQELVDCSGSYGNYGCNGGLMTAGYKYILDNKITTEKAYPYTAQTGSCQHPKGKKYSITGQSPLTQGTMSELSSHLVKQPVAVALEVDYGFQAYTGGIYESNASCGDQLNHGVVAVGQGVDGSKRFLKIRNSWGPSWGEAGYIRLAYGSPDSRGTCGVANSWDTVPQL